MCHCKHVSILTLASLIRLIKLSPLIFTFRFEVTNIQHLNSNKLYWQKKTFTGLLFFFLSHVRTLFSLFLSVSNNNKKILSSHSTVRHLEMTCGHLIMLDILWNYNINRCTFCSLIIQAASGEIHHLVNFKHTGEINLSWMKSTPHDPI